MAKEDNSESGRSERTDQLNVARVAIIVLHWNGWKDTLECLESLQHLTYPNYQIILTENGSTNDSIERIREWCEGALRVNTPFVGFSADLKPLKLIEYDRALAEIGGEPIKEGEFMADHSNRRIIIIKTGENLGFPGGNNVAIRYALRRHYDYVWLLNNDTAVHAEALSELLRIAENVGRVGIVGSKILNYENQDIQSIGSHKIVWPTFSRMPYESLPEGYIEAKWLGGSSLLVKRQVIEQVGMLDERYFLYGEEKDWCISAGRRGWKVCCVPTSIVWHKGGASMAATRAEKPSSAESAKASCKSGLIPEYYGTRNAIYFVKKCYPQHLVPYILYRTLYLLCQAIFCGDRRIDRIKIILRGTWDGIIGKMGKTLDPHACLSDL